jgi:hypothetical protein
MTPISSGASSSLSDAFTTVLALRTGEVCSERFGSIERAVANGLALGYNGGPCFRPGGPPFLHRPGRRDPAVTAPRSVIDVREVRSDRSVAHIAGCAVGPPGTAEYEAAAERERAWQRGWFRDLVAKSQPVVSSSPQECS